MIIIDFETRSSTPIGQGAHSYSTGADTEVLMLAWKFCADDVADFDHAASEPAQIWQIGEDVSPLTELYQRVGAGETVVAHNAEFELQIWNNVLFPSVQHSDCPFLEVEQCMDTMAMAQAMALPRGLDALCKHLTLDEDQAKMAEGKALIHVFCKPRRASKANSDSYWTAETRPDKWATFLDYCLQDVETLYHVLPHLNPLRKAEKALWDLTMHMNNKGVPVDIPSCEGVTKTLAEYKHIVNDQMNSTTDGVVATCSQVSKLTEWCKGKGFVVKDLTAASVREYVNDESIDPDVREALRLRQTGSRTSGSKYKRWLQVAVDGHLLGGLGFHGAGTGRFSSAGGPGNLQNLARGDGSEPHTVVRVLGSGDGEFAAMLYEDVTAAASSGVRAMLKAPDGCEWVVADYSSVENRVAAWVAKDMQTLQLFEDDLDQYKDMATTMFHVDYDGVSKFQRQVAKSAVLGCQFGLGAKAYAGYAAQYGVDLTEDECVETVKAYRDRYHLIKEMWYRCGESAKQAVIASDSVGPVHKNPATKAGDYLRFQKQGEHLYMKLPSGRNICFPFAKLVNHKTPWGSKSVAIEALRINPVTRRVGREVIIGANIFQSAVQGIARDVLTSAMMRLDKRDWDVRMCVHDEILCLENEGARTAEELGDVMCEAPKWAEGLPLAAEGFVAKRFKK